MNSQELLVKLLYLKLKKNNFKPSDFIFEFKEDSCIVTVLNRSHTVLLKIKINDFETEKNAGEYVLKLKDLLDSNYNVYNIETIDYHDRLVHCFDDKLFDDEGYVNYLYSDLKRIFNAFSYGKVLVDCFGHKSVYDIEFLKSIFILEPYYVNMKQDDGLLYVKYNNCSIGTTLFTVYYVIAPKHVDPLDTDVILRGVIGDE